MVIGRQREAHERLHAGMSSVDVRSVEQAAGPPPPDVEQRGEHRACACIIAQPNKGGADRPIGMAMLVANETFGPRHDVLLS